VGSVSKIGGGGGTGKNFLNTDGRSETKRRFHLQGSVVPTEGGRTYPTTKKHYFGAGPASFAKMEKVEGKKRERTNPTIYLQGGSKGR